MSWKRWKLGVLVSGLTGFFTGVLGLGLGLHWRGALVLLAGSVGKDFLLFIKDHPVESITFDTSNFPATVKPTDKTS